MKQFKRDKRIAIILSFIGFGVTATSLLSLGNPVLTDWARFATAALGFAGSLCIIIGCHGLGYLSGFDSAIDKLLDMGFVDMDRYERCFQQRQAASQRGEKANGQDLSGEG